MFKRLRTYWEKSKVIREVGSFDARGLICAVEDGKYASLGVLIDAGVSLQSRDSKGNPALIRAIEKEQFPALKMLIEAGAEIDVRGKGEETPLMASIQQGNRQIFAYLLEQQPDLERCDEQGETALFKAVRLGNTTFARKIIEGGAEVDLRNRIGETPLMLAADHQKVGIVKSLLQAGADPNTMDGKGHTVLNRNHLSPRLQKMLQKAAREHQGTYQPQRDLPTGRKVGGILTGLTPLGSMLGDWLIEAGHLLNSPTAMHSLQQKGLGLLQRWDQVKETATDSIQTDTQHWLKEVLQQLKRLDLSFPSLNGQKLPEQLPALPEDLRAELQHALAHLTEFLATRKEEKPQAEKSTPLAEENELSVMLCQAVAGQASELVDRVLKLGADPNTGLSDGTLPLHLAVANTQTEIVLKLLVAGAQPLRIDGTGRTALGYAQTDEIRDMLLQSAQSNSHKDPISPSSDAPGMPTGSEEG